MTDKKAYIQGMHDALLAVLTTIEEKNVENTKDLVPALMFALFEYSENRSLQ